MFVNDSAIRGLWLASSSPHLGNDSPARGYLGQWYPRLGSAGPQLIPVSLGLNIVYGCNGAGKTQLLDAIHSATQFAHSAYEGFVLEHATKADVPDNEPFWEPWPEDLVTTPVLPPRSDFWTTYSSTETYADLGCVTGFAVKKIRSLHQETVGKIIDELRGAGTLLVTRGLPAVDSRLSFRHPSPQDMNPPNHIDVVPVLLPDAEAPTTRAVAEDLRQSFLALLPRLLEASEHAESELAESERLRILETWIEGWSWCPLLNRRNLFYFDSQFEWMDAIDSGSSRILNRFADDLLMLPALIRSAHVSASRYGEFELPEYPRVCLVPVEKGEQKANLNLSEAELGIPDEELPCMPDPITNYERDGYAPMDLYAKYAHKYEQRLRNMLQFLPNLQRLKLDLEVRHSTYYDESQGFTIHEGCRVGATVKFSAPEEDDQDLELAPLAIGTRRTTSWYSAAESRWLNLALAACSMPPRTDERWFRLADGEADFEFLGAVGPHEPQAWALIDEPEAGLHRSAESLLAQSLGSPDWQSGGVVIVATHCPELLDIGARTLHIERGLVSQFTAETLRDLHAVGLRPSDLIGFLRCVLLVEGEHEKIIFETLFGEELRRIGCRIIIARGGRNMKDIFDSQFLFHYSDANLVCLVDNLSTPLLEEIWFQAQQKASHSPPKAKAFLHQRLPRQISGENRFMAEFMTQALQSGRGHRVEVAGLSKPDILMYFDSSNFGLDRSWDQLVEECGPDRNLKQWAKDRYQANFSAKSIEKAAQNCRAIPAEFTTLLDRLSMASRLLGVTQSSGRLVN